jgi:hypothetical protein
MKHGTRMIDLTGRQFGYLTALRLADAPVAGRTGKHKQWVCLCECGNTCIRDSNDLKRLRRGKPVRPSCGCKNGMQGHRVVEVVAPLDFEAMAFRNLYLHFQKRHRRYGGEMISFPEFSRKVMDLCFYCDEPPLNRHRHQDTKVAVAYNGLDRIECSLGYSAGNVVTACKWCNVMRMDQPFDQFLARIRRIHLKHSS